MRDAEVDQPRLLAPGHHFDRETEGGARLAQELRRILGHAQRIGADGAHRLPRQAAQPFAEARQGFERARLRGAVDALVVGQPGAEAHAFAQAVERVDLAVDRAPDLQVKTVGTEVDRGEYVGTWHRISMYHRAGARANPRRAAVTMTPR